jgi:hypothetical protein
LICIKAGPLCRRIVGQVLDAADHPHVAALGNPAAKLRQQLAQSASPVRSVTPRDYEALM